MIVLALAKLLEAVGLVIILGGFITRFPQIIAPPTFIWGLLLFFSGWIIEHYFVKQ